MDILHTKFVIFQSFPSRSSFNPFILGLFFIIFYAFHQPFPFSSHLFRFSYKSSPLLTFPSIFSEHFSNFPHISIEFCLVYNRCVSYIHFLLFWCFQTDLYHAQDIAHIIFRCCAYRHCHFQCLTRSSTCFHVFSLVLLRLLQIRTRTNTKIDLTYLICKSIRINETK